MACSLPVFPVHFDSGFSRSFDRKSQPLIKGNYPLIGAENIQFDGEILNCCPVHESIHDFATKPLALKSWENAEIEHIDVIRFGTCLQVAEPFVFPNNKIRIKLFPFPFEILDLPFVIPSPNLLDVTTE